MMDQTKLTRDPSTLSLIRLDRRPDNLRDHGRDNSGSRGVDLDVGRLFIEVLPGDDVALGCETGTELDKAACR